MFFFFDSIAALCQWEICQAAKEGLRLLTWVSVSRMFVEFVGGHTDDEIRHNRPIHLSDWECVANSCLGPTYFIQIFLPVGMSVSVDVASVVHSCCAGKKKKNYTRRRPCKPVNENRRTMKQKESHDNKKWKKRFWEFWGLLILTDSSFLYGMWLFNFQPW